MINLILLPALIGIIGILFVAVTSIRIVRNDPGTPAMVAISDSIREGAMAFLAREYQAIAIFMVVMFIALSFGINLKTALAFIFGAICSLSAGYIGMQISTRANTRTAQAATRGFNKVLGVAFFGGAVMGMYVVSVGLFALSLLYFVFIKTGTNPIAATDLMAGFSMGASSVALFARVGGGIYTKAADVGADLCGKIEACIPEDDPRNPAVIADLVGDNVGDVAGMGADLYESYVGAIVSSLVISASVFPTPEAKIKGIVLTLLMAGVGILASLLGTLFVREGKRFDPQASLRHGTYASAILFSLGAFLITYFWFGNLNVFYAVFSGIIAGMTIGFTAEFYTSGRSVQLIAESSQTGAATTILQGFATGLRSTILPMVIIVLSILISYYFAGIFGIAMAAVGMLAIAGITISVDAYGPIADNAGGIAEMTHMGPEVRKITDTLDAAGNTTAAIAKGFAIGSAALTALALLSAYTQATHISSINLMEATVIGGLLLGGIIPFMFAASAIQAVSRAAFKVVEEVRRQFKEIPGLMEGTAKAQYSYCIDITTKAALKEMILPSVLAVLIPLATGMILGREALAGLLAGSLVTGVPLALLFANAGGAWDNAKKYIEAGNLGGKGSDTHKAAVTGDTVGDPFKDTAAPAMNILLKLMAVVSLVFAPLIIMVHQYLINFIP